MLTTADDARPGPGARAEDLAQPAPHPAGGDLTGRDLNSKDRHALVLGASPWCGRAGGAIAGLGTQAGVLGSVVGWAEPLHRQRLAVVDVVRLDPLVRAAALAGFWDELAGAAGVVDRVLRPSLLGPASAPRGLDLDPASPSSRVAGRPSLHHPLAPPPRSDTRSAEAIQARRASRRAQGVRPRWKSGIEPIFARYLSLLTGIPTKSEIASYPARISRRSSALCMGNTKTCACVACPSRSGAQGEYG